MRRIILTAAALALTGPALAASQLESNLGVSPDFFTTAELARLHLLQDGDDSRRIFFETEGNLVISTHSFEPASASKSLLSNFLPKLRN